MLSGASRPDPIPHFDRFPAYRLTQARAADLLGVSTARVAELVGEGRLTPVAKWAKSGRSARTWSGGRSSGGGRATRRGSRRQRRQKSSV